MSEDAAIVAGIAVVCAAILALVFLATSVTLKGDQNKRDHDMARVEKCLELEDKEGNGPNVAYLCIKDVFDDD